jgi:hypothetical protein
LSDQRVPCQAFSLHYNQHNEQGDRRTRNQRVSGTSWTRPAREDFFADNSGEYKRHDLEDFITQLNILHLSSIAGSQYQNALAEHAGGWRLGNAIRHDFDMSGLGSAFLKRVLERTATQRPSTFCSQW